MSPQTSSEASPHLVIALGDPAGIGMEVVRSAPLKAVPSPFEEPTEAGRAVSESIVQDLFGQFVGLVTERRNLDQAALEAAVEAAVAALACQRMVGKALARLVGAIMAMSEGSGMDSHR